jgi:virulence factor Mce-like protein
LQLEVRPAASTTAAGAASMPRDQILLATARALAGLDPRIPQKTAKRDKGKLRDGASQDGSGTRGGDGGRKRGGGGSDAGSGDPPARTAPPRRAHRPPRARLRLSRRGAAGRAAVRRRHAAARLPLRRGRELMGGRSSGIAGNPVLIGAATVLVILVAVFLSYNANQGLPFVPSYKLKAQTPSAANLVRGNEVRIGGTRVGSVDTIDVQRQQDGTNIAVLGLKLEKTVAPLPKDSTVLIRPRSALGLKYVEITRGQSDQGFEDGDTIPLAQATPAPVEFDEFVNMFDQPTRDAAQINLREFGDAFAAAGQSINQAIGALRPLLVDIIPVTNNLTSKETNLPRFISSLARTASIVAPAAQEQAASS